MNRLFHSDKKCVWNSLFSQVKPHKIGKKAVYFERVGDEGEIVSDLRRENEEERDHELRLAKVALRGLRILLDP